MMHFPTRWHRQIQTSVQLGPRGASPQQGEHLSNQRVGIEWSEERFAHSSNSLRNLAGDESWSHQFTTTAACDAPATVYNTSSLARLSL